MLLFPDKIYEGEEKKEVDAYLEGQMNRALSTEYADFLLSKGNVSKNTIDSLGPNINYAQNTSAVTLINYTPTYENIRPQDIEAKLGASRVYYVRPSLKEIISFDSKNLTPQQSIHLRLDRMALGLGLKRGVQVSVAASDELNYNITGMMSRIALKKRFYMIMPNPKKDTLNKLNTVDTLNAQAHLGAKSNLGVRYLWGDMEFSSREGFFNSLKNHAQLSEIADKFLAFEETYTLRHQLSRNVTNPLKPNASTHKI